MSDSGSRRNFFKPKTLGKLLSTVTEGEWSASARASQGLICRVGREAMATRFEILMDFLDFDFMPAAEKGLELIADLETQMTVYREESEVSRLNAIAAEEAVPVEPLLFSLFQQCREWWDETDQAFDITLHALLKEWGLFKGPRRVPSPEDLENLKTRSGFDKVILDEQERTVRYRVPGVGINLAAVGKGYALDRCGGLLKENGLKHFLVHGGHSSMLGQGTSTWDRGWLVDLLHPLDWSVPLAKVRLLNMALSTSALERETVLEGKIPHVLDPRTGCPVEADLLSVSVLTTTAAKAEALSTALLVMGLDNAVEYCEKHDDVGAVLIRWNAELEAPELILTAYARPHVEVLN
jgi:thiamine biosynthesis lipoprotein